MPTRTSPRAGSSRARRPSCISSCWRPPWRCCRSRPSDSWKPHGGGNPTLQILALLAASLGLPYFVLSTTGPLIQQWFSRAQPGGLALPPLCALECRLAARPGQLPLLLRDAFHPQDPGGAVGVGVGRVCALLRVLRDQTVEVRRPEVQKPEVRIQCGTRSRRHAPRPRTSTPSSSTLRPLDPQPAALASAARPARRCCCWRRPTSCARTWR